MASPNILMNEYLKGFKVKGDQDYTHLLWTDNAKGKCYVSPMEMPRFWEVYNFNLENELELGVLEKHRDIAPVLIDFDFKQITKTRKYNIEEVNDFVNEYHDCISKYVEVPDKARYFILEKPAPRKVEKKLEWRDGIHIECPDIITKPSIQYKVRAEMLKNWKYFDFCKNGKDDVFDKAVIEKNAWFMYGSKKPDEEHPWKVSSIIFFENGELNQEDLHYTDKELLEILSIRNKHTENEVLEDKVEEMEAFEASMKPSPIVSNMESVPIKYSGNVAEVPLMCDLLSPDRADNYHDWIKVGIALRNTDEGFLPVWIDFSKKSSKFNEGECERLWNSFGNITNKQLTIGSIYWWAKQDNPEGYKAIQKTSLNELMRKAQSGNEFDIAYVVFELFKGNFVYCDGLWFEFNNHKWKEITEGLNLKQKFSREVADEFRKQASFFARKACEGKDDAEKEKCDEIVKKLQSVITKLKKTAFKKSIIEECKEFFKNEDFIDKLDENRKLVGFENGVYDLDNMTFREGQPEDYITLTTEYTFTEISNPVIRNEIQKFLYSIHEDEEITNYLMDTLALGIDGVKKHQLIIFWTGTGGNGKGIINCLVKGAFGKLCATPNIGLYINKKTTASQCHPELIGVKGRRLMVSTEPERDDIIQVGQLKALTGGDTMSARQLYCKTNVEFELQAYPIIQMNKKPVLSGTDGGVKRRLRVIDFPMSFVDNPKLSHERPINLDLKEKFDKDKEYHREFFLMLLERYKVLKANGFKLNTPKIVEELSNEYLDEHNYIKRFIDETYDVVAKTEAFEYSSDLTQRYNFWADNNNGPKSKRSEINEALNMYKLKIEKKHGNVCGVHLEGNMVILGLKLKKQYRMESDDDYE